MRTKELLLKNDLTRGEKIAHLKKLRLWREFQIELTAQKGHPLYLFTLHYILNLKCGWETFISSSFIFSRTKRGHEFWHYVAKNGKKPLNKYCYEI